MRVVNWVDSNESMSRDESSIMYAIAIGSTKMHVAP